MGHYTAARAWGDILPRYAFLEPLLRGKRILELGCGDGQGAACLLSRGASSVLGMDLDGPDLQAALRSGRRAGLAFRPFDGRRIESPSAAFDVIVAFELGERLEPGLLAEVERVLRPGGILVTALANPAHVSLDSLVGRRQAGELPGFERLVSVLQERFPSVSVLAQTPFLGFSLGWMGAEAQDLPLEMDSSLLAEGGEDVAYYLMLCGREPVVLESQALVQLPFGQVVRELMAGREPAPGPAAETAGAAPAPESPGDHARVLSLLEAERQELGARVAQLELRLVDSEQQAAGLRQQVVRQQQQIERMRAELADQPADERPALQQALLRSRSDLEEARAELDRARGAAVEAAARAASGEAERGEALRRLEELRASAKRREEELAEKVTWLEAARAELARLEEELDRRRRSADVQAQRLQEQEQALQAAARRDREREQTLAATRDRLREAESALVAAESEREQARRVWQAAQAEAQTRRVELEGVRTELAAAHGTAAELVAERDRLLESLRGLEEQLTQERAARATREAEVARAQAAAQALERERLAEREAQQAQGARLQALGEERDALRRAREDQEEDLLRLRQKLTAEAEARLETERRLGEQAARNQELESDLVEMVNRMEDGQARAQQVTRLDQAWRSRLEHQEGERRAAQEKIDELTRELYAARKQEEELAAALELLRTAALEQSEGRAALAAELAELRQADRSGERRLEAALAEGQAERAALVARAEALDREILRLQALLQEREAGWREGLDLSAERERILQERLAALQRQVAGMEQGTGRELASLGEQLRRRDQQLGTLSERLSDLDAQRRRLEERAAHLEAELVKALTEMAPARQAAEREAAARVRAEGEADLRVARMRQALAQAEESAREAEARWREAEERLLEVGRSREALQGAQRGWFERVRALEADLAQAQSELLGLRPRVEALAGLEAGRAGMMQEIADRDQHVRLLERELAVARERLTGLERELGRMAGQP